MMRTVVFRSNALDEQHTRSRCGRDSSSKSHSAIKSNRDWYYYHTYGYVLGGTASGATPSTNSTWKLQIDEPRTMLSRLSDRLGKLMAKTFPNYILVSFKSAKVQAGHKLTPSV
jgi:hypothetical protein